MTTNDTTNNIEAPPLRIRPASLRDGPAIVRVVRQAFTPAPGSFTPGKLAPGRLADISLPGVHPSNYDAQRFAADGQLGRTFYAAEIDGQIGGVVAVRVLDHRTGEIVRLAVLPEYRKQGFGSALMVYALAWGREQELMRMELMMPAPQGALRQWFEGFGFTTTVTRELDHVAVPVSWMSRTLRPVTVRPIRRGQLTDPAALCGAAGE
ncbi:MAG: GNAT family N-acetyltransferase [Phycisphaerales bacterium]